MVFQREDGLPVPAVTAEEMRRVDTLAVETFGLGILQMMEHAGRALAEHVLLLRAGRGGPVVVLAGPGGNGGGGLCCARHLHNRGVPTAVALDRPVEALRGPAAAQMRALRAAGLQPLDDAEIPRALAAAGVVVDALVGYGLVGPPRGRVAELIVLAGSVRAPILALDVPSGIDATTGEAPGPAIRPTRTVTLALPKTGLTSVRGDLFLADIGIPPVLYRSVGLDVGPIFGERWWVPLRRVG